MSKVRTRYAVQYPTESEEQQALFEWAALQRGKFPALSLMFHIPNGGRRSKAEAGRFKAEGVKAGVPDLCLPVARGGFHGLYIELKRQNGGILSEAQEQWRRDLQQQGYRAEVCHGWQAAAEVIIEYLTAGENEVNPLKAVKTVKLSTATGNLPPFHKLLHKGEGSE